MHVELRHIPMPPLEVPAAVPVITEAEYITRNRAMYQLSGADWVLVYGDREHNANLIFLTGFDPRFEEALLVIGPHDRRVLLVGNEGVVHAVEAGLPLEIVLCQPFSLMAQPRGDSAPLATLLGAIGVAPEQSVGIAGWKYFEDDEPEVPDAGLPAYVPMWVVDAVEQITDTVSVDVTHVLMNPVNGLRAIVSSDEIARAEWGASRASAAVLRVVQNARPGQSELEAMVAMGYAGEPMSCHPILASSDGALNGLRSPGARIMNDGDAVTCGVGYWGGLCCRAGLLQAEPDAGFTKNTVIPYFRAIATWWSSLAIGLAGGDLYDAVITALGDASFRPMLNPGHLTSSDEWVHSPIAHGSRDTLQSGMILQCDIIPTPLPPGRALNCEDTVALADADLRAEIANRHPDLWERIVARRTFMIEHLGIQIGDDVLPLSVAPAWLPPYWLGRDLVCTVASR